jgi:hypothetical protein
MQTDIEPVSFDDVDHGKIVCRDIKLAQRFVEANIDLRIFNINSTEAFQYLDIVEYLIRHNLQIDWTSFKHNLISVRQIKLENFKKLLLAICEANIEPFDKKKRCNKILSLIRVTKLSKESYREIIDYICTIYTDFDPIELLLSKTSITKYFERNAIERIFVYVIDPIKCFGSVFSGYFEKFTPTLNVTPDKNFVTIMKYYGLNYYDFDIGIHKLVSYGFIHSIQYFKSIGCDVFDDSNGMLSISLIKTARFEIFDFYAKEKFEIDFSQYTSSLGGIFYAADGSIHDRLKLFRKYYSEAINGRLV